jgi:hypothetical protein
MIHIKLGERRNVTFDDPMHRDWVGYDQTVPLEDLFARNRGRWVLGARAERERYAAFSYTGDHKIKFIAEIEGFQDYGSKRAIIGHLLDESDPIAQRLAGTDVPDHHRNPVTYFTERDAEPVTCACGCGGVLGTSRAFIPGHDHKAIHSRITRQWGSTLAFIEWFDRTYAA